MPTFRLALLLLFSLGGVAAAQQGQVSQQPGSQEIDEVMVGAGTTGDVTTGSSGGDGGGGGGDDDPIEPIEVDMPHPEQPDGLVGMPGSLPITPPRQLRCEIIEDEAARGRCEETDLSAAQ